MTVSQKYTARIFVVRGKDVSSLLDREISYQIGLVQRVVKLTDHAVFGGMGLFNSKPVEIKLKLPKSTEKC